jgi:hypothetical protein
MFFILKGKLALRIRSGQVVGKLTANSGRKDQGLTLRAQREEHRGHGENANKDGHGKTPTGDADVRHWTIGAREGGKPRHYKRKAAARLPHSKKEKAPSGIGAHFSTLTSLPD